MADGNYATRAQLATRIGSDRLNKLSDTDNALQDSWIAAAESLVDSYLCQRYATPVATAVPLLLTLTLDIAEAYAYRHKPPSPDEVEAKYESAVLVLRDISVGKAALPASAPIAATTVTDYEAATGVGDGDAEPVFTRDDMRGL